MGDAASIGPEIIVKALKRRYNFSQPLIIEDRCIMGKGAASAKLGGRTSMPSAPIPRMPYG